MHHLKVTRYSCNLNIGMEHNHTVQTQIRLLRLSRICTIAILSFKKSQKKILLWFDPKYWAEIFEHTLCIQIMLLHLIRVYPIFYSSFSNNLAILLAIFDTADQTDQSNQGLHDKLFCRFKQTRKKIRLCFDPKYWAEIFEHTLCIQIILLHLILGLRNFLFYFFNYFSCIGYNSCIVSQYLALLWCVDHSKGENYHIMTNTPGKF